MALVGPFPFEETEVLASLVAPLAEAGISVMAIATYDTDILFVPASDWPVALAALESAGHVLVD